MSEVFLSYARDDEAVARRVAKALEAAGYAVWWDAQLPAHRAYSEIIEKRLEEAEAVVVLWSNSAARSQWVRAEADFARSHAKLVQAQLDSNLPPMPFNQIQCASLVGWRGGANHAGWRKMADSVATLVSGEEQPPAPPLPATRRLSRRVVAVAALALVALFAALMLVPQFLPDRKAARPVVAVLPFKSLDARDASLVAGIWEDTRQAISRNPQLLVLGPNTSEELAGKGNQATRKAADFLIEANVRSVGDRIRVSANLVRTKDGAQVWSQNFDRRLDDVFALQSEMARQIEGHIRGRLAEGGGVKPENIATSGEVYALYSDARTKIRKRQVRNYDQVYAQLQQVVRMDPNFAPGWATLAVVKKLGAFGGDISVSTAESDARHAIALAPNLAAAHAALGFALGKSPAAQVALRRAVQLDPNDYESLNWLAISLDVTQSREMLQLYSKIVEIEPLWWPAILNKINLLFDLGNSAAVEQELARVERLGATGLIASTKIKLLTNRGDLSSAVNVGIGYLRQASPSEREFIANFLWQPLAQLGYLDVADKVSPPPNASYIRYIRQNDPRAIGMIEAEMPPRKYWSFALLAIVGSRVYLLNNQGPRLAKRFQAVASTPEQFEALVGKEQLPDVAPMAALALRSAGDTQQARRLLELAEADATKLKPNKDQQVTLARIYAVQGRTDEAIGLLSSAIRAGWLPPYLPILPDIQLDPPLAELRKDPRFEQLRQQILGHLAKERAELGPVTL